MRFEFGETEYDSLMRKKNWIRVKVRNPGELRLAVEYIYGKCEGSDLVMVDPTWRIKEFEADNTGVVCSLLQVDYYVGFR